MANCKYQVICIPTEALLRMPARLVNRAVHPLVMALPTGLCALALVCMITHAAVGAPDNWSVVDFSIMAGGVIGSLAAAGLMDVSAPPGNLKCLILRYLIINLIIVTLSATWVWLRARGVSELIEISLATIGLALSILAGWLSGKLVCAQSVITTPVESSAEHRVTTISA